MMDRECRTFLGFRLRQHHATVQAFSAFFNSLSATGRSPDSIIELGTGEGGLTIFLGLYCWHSNCRLYSFDICSPRDRPDKYNVLLDLLGVECYQGDVLADLAIIAKISRLLCSDGRALLLCDNGHKVREFTTYASSLKAGDFIMAHDYMDTKEIFLEDYFGKVWDSCEITFADIAGTAEDFGLKFVYRQTFDRVAWLCMERVGQNGEKNELH